MHGTIAAMTAPQIAAAATRQTPILLPIGVIEAHGPHLPTGTDAYIATTICHRVRHHATRELLIAPPFTWGINAVLGHFPGSFAIRPATAQALLTDILHSLLANRFHHILLVSHHGDLAHNQMLLAVLQSFHAAHHPGIRWLYAPNRWTMIERLAQTGDEPLWFPWTPTPALTRFRTTGTFGVHADEYETAAMVRYHPETVDFDALEHLPPTTLTRDDLPAWRQGGPAATSLTPGGYFGAPNPVDPDLWRHYEDTARLMAQAIDHHLPTPQPHPK